MIDQRHAGDGRPSLLLVAPAYAESGIPQQDVHFEVLAGYLRRRGFPVEVVDAQVSRLAPPALADHIRRSGASLVYLNLAGRADIKAVRETVEALGGPLAGAPLLAGGQFGSRHDLEILRRLPEIDAIVKGEPEPTLEALGKRLRRKEAWRDEAGLCLRLDEGGRNPPRPLMENLDILPMAVDDLFEPSRLERGQKVLFSRGCNSDCLYCGLQTPYLGDFPSRRSFWRSRSAVSIADEIEHYHRTKGASYFLFNSFVFLGHDRVGSVLIAEVAEEILRRRLTLKFSFTTHPHHLIRNRDLLPLLKEAGLSQVRLGIDSAIPRFMRLYNLEFTIDESREAVRLLHEAKVNFIPIFVFFDPYLSMDEIHTNLNFLTEIQPWFQHLKKPFPYFLERHLLGTSLKVQAEMPLYRTLVNDGLADERDPLEGHPTTSFRYRETEIVFNAHRTIRNRFGSSLQPLLFSSRTLALFPRLSLFPLELLRTVVKAVESLPHPSEPEVTAHVCEWLLRQPEPIGGVCKAVQPG